MFIARTHYKVIKASDGPHLTTVAARMVFCGLGKLANETEASFLFSGVEVTFHIFSFLLIFVGF